MTRTAVLAVLLSAALIILPHCNAEPSDGIRQYR